MRMARGKVLKKTNFVHCNKKNTLIGIEMTILMETIGRILQPYNSTCCTQTDNHFTVTAY